MKFPDLVHIQQHVSPYMWREREKESSRQTTEYWGTESIGPITLQRILYYSRRECPVWEADGELKVWRAFNLRIGQPDSLKFILLVCLNTVVKAGIVHVAEYGTLWLPWTAFHFFENGLWLGFPKQSAPWNFFYLKFNKGTIKYNEIKVQPGIWYLKLCLIVVGPPYNKTPSITNPMEEISKTPSRLGTLNLNCCEISNFGFWLELEVQPPHRIEMIKLCITQR